MSSYPDYGKAPPEYLLTVTEFIAGLAPDERHLLVDKRLGIAAKCRFLPSVGDMAELLLADKTRREQFRPAHTTYRRLEFDADPPMEPLDHRRRVVAETLGYDPQDRRGRSMPSPENVAAATAAVSRFDEARAAGEPLPLKTPAAPASEYLKELLWEQDYGERLD